LSRISRGIFKLPATFKISARSRGVIRIVRPFWVVLWILGAASIVYMSANSELNRFYKDQNKHIPACPAGKNEIRGLSFTKHVPQQNGRAVYSVHFKNLRAENNRLGIFKSAIHKIVKIQDLDIEFKRYSFSEDTAATELKGSKSSIATAEPHGDLHLADGRDACIFPEEATSNEISRVITEIASLKNRWHIDIELGNVSEVLVNNFDYKVLYDGELFFGIHSKTATASGKQRGLLLRGHATVKAADGSILESNCIKWDTKKGYFVTDGIYVLSHNGTKTTGKNACFDIQLNNIEARQAAFNQKEDGKWVARLQ